VTHEDAVALVREWKRLVISSDFFVEKSQNTTGFPARPLYNVMRRERKA